MRLAPDDRALVIHDADRSLFQQYIQSGLVAHGCGRTHGPRSAICEEQPPADSAEPQSPHSLQQFLKMKPDDASAAQTIPGSDALIPQNVYE